MRVRIVVLNYNGEKYVEECFPSIVRAAANAEYPVRVTVLDNLSTDRSLEMIRSRFPDVEVVVAPENRVLCSYNDYLGTVDEPVVILLNNDLRVAEDFLGALVRPFLNRDDVFMVTPKSLTPDGQYDTGRCRSRIKAGLFWSACRFPGYKEKTGAPSATTSAGYGAFDRLKFLELGGYDDLYLPGRLEDNDICFRAWRKGWKSLYEPASVVYHLGAASFKVKYGEERTLVLAHRNSFLFFWKNIWDLRYLFIHVALLGPRLLYAAVAGNRALVKGFFDALPLFWKALERRRKTWSEPREMKDREIFDLVK